MTSRPRIGLAFPRPGERAAFQEWLDSAGFEPVPMIDVGSIARVLDGASFEALIIDDELLASGDTPFVLRRLGPNRPLIVIGEAGPSRVGEPARRGVTYLARPLARDALLLAVALALGEGRPARRSRRRHIARIHAAVDGVGAKLLDVSYEGIRLELPERHRLVLPPVFNVRVPMFNLILEGRRVWVNNAMDRSAGAVWCGVRLSKHPERVTIAWHTLVDTAPAATQFTSELRKFP